MPACESRPSVKETHNCVADVLERYGSGAPPDVRSVFQAAASGLRAAANKAQALLAIARCQAVVAAALKQLGRSSGSSYASRVLSAASRLIQRKG